MRLRPTERQQIFDLLREEIEGATNRVSERLAQYEYQPAKSKSDELDGVRQFYSELTEKDWTAADEAALANLHELCEGEIKQMLRDAFRRSRVYPIPSFASLVNVMKRVEEEPHAPAGVSLNNPDAMPAAERDRLANTLHRELLEAADEIAQRLKLGETKAEIVREQLEVVAGAIIGRFMPLV
jgi:hypothetical protein